MDSVKRTSKTDLLLPLAVLLAIAALALKTIPKPQEHEYGTCKGIHKVVPEVPFREEPFRKVSHHPDPPESGMDYCEFIEEEGK